MTKTALITGIKGQDGFYLAKLLLLKNYRVVGLVRNKILPAEIAHLPHEVEYLLGDLNDPNSIQKAICTIMPDEIYNLASQSYPVQSWQISIETGLTNGIGAHQLFEITKNYRPSCKICQASSSEMYGDNIENLQNEQTGFNPTNPYAAAKLYAHHIAKIYRQQYGLFICNAVLFNHESPRRGMHFITQKVTYAAACLKLGIMTSPQLNEKGLPIVSKGKLSLGNLHIQRDWGHAADYVDALWRMLQLPTAQDFVIGTGELNSIKSLCDLAFSYVNLNWQDYVVIDPQLIRPTETGPAVADTRKANTLLNWRPTKTFAALIHELVDTHLKSLVLPRVNNI